VLGWSTNYVGPACEADPPDYTPASGCASATSARQLLTPDLVVGDVRLLPDPGGPGSRFMCRRPGCSSGARSGSSRSATSSSCRCTRISRAVSFPARIVEAQPQLAALSESTSQLRQSWLGHWPQPRECQLHHIASVELRIAIRTLPVVRCRQHMQSADPMRHKLSATCHWTRG